MFLLLPAEASFAESNEFGIITTNNLNFRPAPGLNNTPLNKLHKGTKVLVLKHHNGWLKINHDGQIGYIRNHKRYVRLHELKTKKKKQGYEL